MKIAVSEMEFSQADMIAQSLLCAFILFCIWKREFFKLCENMNIERLIREEWEDLNSWEAKIILAQMNKVRVS